jgi:hypothetical protein
VAVYFELGNELSGSIKGGEFLDYLMVHLVSEELCSIELVIKKLQADPVPVMFLYVVSICCFYMFTTVRSSRPFFRFVRRKKDFRYPYYRPTCYHHVAIIWQLIDC